ncbi:MAG: hypothetical protein IKR40_11010 [Treponema sp.]|nr:hypothetical protein [Treponema sp.]
MITRKIKFTFAVMVLILCPAMIFAGAGKKDKTLIDQGLKLTSLIKEKAGSKEYIAMFFGPQSQLTEFLPDLTSADYTTPSAVHCLSGDFTQISTLLMSEVQEADFSSISEIMGKDISQRILSVIPNMWNSMSSGPSGIAMANVLSSSSVFVCKELKEDCMYIFSFGEAYPVAVSFLCGEDGAVLAKASLVLDEDFISSLEEMLSEISPETGIKMKMEKIR